MIDPAVETMLRSSFAAQGAMQALGARIVALDVGECTLELTAHSGTSQQHGYFHGGVIGALADSAGGYATNTVLMPSHECLTAEYKINFLNPALGSVLKARGKVLRAGRSLVVATVEVTSDHDGKTVVCAVAQMTLFAVTTRTTQDPYNRSGDKKP
jgi:uncharacterized protein (TIGR00369 family)